MVAARGHDPNNPVLRDGTALIKKIQEYNPFPGNYFIATDFGDIAYASVGLNPTRNVMETSYTKHGNRKESVWTGILKSSDLPYVVNPDKGYLVSTNNFVGSSRMKHGKSL